MVKKITLQGIVHYLTMSILREQAVNGHQNGVILPFWAWKNKKKKTIKKTMGSILWKYKDQMHWLHSLTDWFHPPADWFHWLGMFLLLSAAGVLPSESALKTAFSDLLNYPFNSRKPYCNGLEMAQFLVYHLKAYFKEVERIGWLFNRLLIMSAQNPIPISSLCLGI